MSSSTKKIDGQQISSKVAQQIEDELLPLLSQHEIYTKGEIFSIFNAWILTKYEAEEKK